MDARVFLGKGVGMFFTFFNVCKSRPKIGTTASKNFLNFFSALNFQN